MFISVIIAGHETKELKPGRVKQDKTKQSTKLPLLVPNWSPVCNRERISKSISLHPTSAAFPYFYLHLPRDSKNTSKSLLLFLSTERSDPCVVSHRLICSNGWHVPYHVPRRMRANHVTRSKSAAHIRHKTIPPRVVVTGASGVGKSTILDRLVGTPKFPSSFSARCERHSGICYVDTPGLPFTRRRQTALNDTMRRTLSGAPQLRVVHVAVLESGRVRPVDIEALALVVSALRVAGVKDKAVYSVVFNKASKAVRELAERDDGKGLEQKLLSSFREVGWIDKQNTCFVIHDRECEDEGDEKEGGIDGVRQDVSQLKAMVDRAPVLSTKDIVVKFEGASPQEEGRKESS